jgi:hypothetical protein
MLIFKQRLCTQPAMLKRSGTARKCKYIQERSQGLFVHACNRPPPHKPVKHKYHVTCYIPSVWSTPVGLLKLEVAILNSQDFIVTQAREVLTYLHHLL